MLYSPQCLGLLVGLLCLIVGICSIGAITAANAAATTCLDNNGKPVDWFIVYKLPRITTSTNALIKKGVGQVYMDINSQRWTLSKQGIDQTGHAVYNTLQQIYGGSKSKLAYLMYNDETPTHTSMDNGHTKGDIGFDMKSGFWLVHSVPKFPPTLNDSYSYPTTGMHYGQSFLCVTYNYQLLDVIGKQLLYTYPQIYDYNLPSSFTSNKNLVNVINHSHVTTAPYNNSVTLKSSGGQQFISFAKCSKFNNELYHAWVAPYLSSDLDVESWLNGEGALPSDCSGAYSTKNVKAVSIAGESFKSSSDHSKWAVTTDQSKARKGNLKYNGNWICIGDINREEGQLTRGGGTVCANLQTVWQAFTGIVGETQPC